MGQPRSRSRAVLLTAVLLNPAVPQPLPFIQRLARDLAVVEMNLARRQNLISLMTFAGDEDHITRPRLQDRAEDSFAAVDHQVVIIADAGKPDPDVVQDQQRVFAARVVRGGDHEVAQPRGLLAHQWAFGAVAVAAAAEDSDHAAPGPAGALVGLRVPHRSQRIDQGVRRVRVIDDYSDVLSVMTVMAVMAVRGHALEAARHAATLLDAARDRLAIEAQREADADRAEYVVGVRAPDQR